MGFLENLSELGGETLGEGKLIVGVDSGPLKKGLDGIGETVKEKSAGWGAAFKAAQIGVIALATAFIGFAVEGTKKADELDAAIGRIAANTGLAAGQSAQLRAGLLDMSTRTQQGVDELAKSIESVAKSGYDVADSLRIQEASAKAATVTHSDLGVVTNTVVTAMKAWKIEAKDVGKVTDTLVTTVGRSRIDWDALSRIIATAAPIAQGAGVSFNDLNAAIIAIGRSGIPARRAAAGVISLMRSLSSPAAQKEMKLLGITVNATTIAHDGLLGTLKKIEAASGKHVSVLVRDKKGQIDYAKSVAATTKANQGQLQAMQAMVGGASGLVTADILLANGAKDYKEGQDALNESLGQTNEQFDKVKEADLSIQLALIRNQITRFAIDLGTNLLPYVAKFLGWMTETIPKALKGIGDLWTNNLRGPVTAMIASFLQFAGAIKDAFFGGGDAGAGAKSFFKGLATLLGDIAKDVGGIFDVFSNILKLPFVKALAPWLALGGVLKVASSLLPAIAKALAGKALGALNFLTGGIFKLTPEKGAAESEASAKTSEAAAQTSEAASGLREASAKSAEALTEAAAKLSESAVQMSEAALRISEASEKQLLGGELGALGGGESFNAAEAIRNQTYIESTIAANETTIRANESQTAADKASLKASDSTVATNEQQQVQLQTDKVVSRAQMETAVTTKQSLAEMAAAVKSGEEATLGVVEEGERARTAIVREAAARGSLGQAFGAGEAAAAAGTGRIRGALGAAGGLIGGLISKAIVPILVAQLASDIVKAPIGDFIAHNTKFKTVGEKIKEDFFGGMIDLARSVFAGTDSWVGKADETIIGNAHISTMELAKLGVTAAQIDDLQSTDPKVSLPAQFDEMTRLQEQLKQRTGETVTQWFHRLSDILGGDFKSSTLTALNAMDTDPTKPFDSDTALKGLLTTSVTRFIGEQYGSLRTSFSSVVGGILVDRGFTKGASAQLDSATSTLITRLSAAGTDKYGALLDFVAQQALGQVGGKLTKPTAATNFGLGPELTAGFDPKVAMARAGESLRENVIEAQKQFSEALDNLPPGQGEAIRKAMKLFSDQTSNVDPGIAQALARKFGAHWQEAMKDGTEQFTAAPDKATSARLQKALGKNWRDILLSIGEGAASPATIAGVQSKLKKAFGDNWKTVFANAVSGTTDQATVKEMTRLFGPNWRAAMAQFGTLLYDSEGGKDRDILIASFKKYAAALVGDLTATDLLPVPKPAHLIPGVPGSKGYKNVEPKMTPAQEKAAKDAVNKAVAQSIKDGTLEATQSPDVVQSQAAIKKLGEDWAKAIPNPAARESFIKQMVALQKTNSTALKSNIFDVLPVMPTHLDNLTAALGRLDSEVRHALMGLPSGPTTPYKGNKSGAKSQGGKDDTPAKSGTPIGKSGVPYAAGGRWDVDSVTHASLGGRDVTIGEAGKEQVAVLSHPRAISWADLLGGGVGGNGGPRLPGMASRGPAGGNSGPRVQLNVDHMHVQSQADEQAILDTFEFMAPGGIA